MSGFFLSPLGAPSSLATATAALPDHSSARSGRGRPTVALLVSGGLHAAALTLFLLATARSGLEPVRTMAIRVMVDPRIDVTRITPPPIDSKSPGGAPSRDFGTIKPVDRRDETLKEILKGLHMPYVSGGVEGGPTTSGPANSPTDVPGYA